jgi:putative membrane protein
MNTNPTFRRVFLFSATALLSAATALAQMHPGGAPGQSVPDQAPSQQQPGQATNPANGMTNGSAASFGDQAFVRQVFESDAAEVQLGQLAQQKSQSPDVKQLGQKMAENRAKLDEQLKPIAQQLSVEMPKKPSKKQKELVAKLEALSGPQFDEEYLKAVAKDNQKDVKNFQSEAGAAQNPNLQQAAKQDESILAQHQQSVEQIAQKHNVQLDAEK